MKFRRAAAGIKFSFLAQHKRNTLINNVLYLYLIINTNVIQVRLRIVPSPNLDAELILPKIIKSGA
jgi:hypothetical protein